MKRIDSILEISQNFDAFCIDMFGVIWNGQVLYPGAADTLERLHALGKKIYILSNTTKPSAQMESEMADKGLIKGTTYDGYISSGSALENKISQGFFEQISDKPDYKFYTVGGIPHTLFKSVRTHLTNDIKSADLVYFGSPALKNNVHENFDHLLPEMEQALKLNKPAVLANPDYHALIGDKKFARAGSMGKWYEDNGGLVYWIGKPYLDIYSFALEKIGAPASRVLMIGDTLRTDIAGGRGAGLKTLLITGTGMTHDDMQSGLDLQTQCRLAGVTPDYTIDRFQ